MLSTFKSIADRLCVKETIKAMWAAFWANVSASAFKKCSIAFKIQRLKVFVLPILAFRFVRWPHTKTLEARILRVQRQMFAIIAQIRPLSDESAEQFCRRRGREVSKLIREYGSWSALWSQRQKAWSEHIGRNTASACWASRLSLFLTVDELEIRRALSQGRPRTRAYFGPIAKRWFEAFCENVVQ